MPRARLALTRDDWSLVDLTLVLKAAVLGLGVLAVVVIGQGSLPHGTFGFFEIWNRWDAPHYQDLAVLGYRATDPGTLTIDGYRRAYPGDLPLYIVFFPMYPWLVGGVTLLLRDPLVSAFLVSGIASLFVAPLLFRVVSADFGRSIGLRAAWFGLIFPTAYFLHIGYTESLFIALVLGSFLAAHRDRWWLAGILGGIAALTRVNGLVLVPALAVEAGLAWWRDPAHRPRVEWLAIGLVLAGFGGYLVLNQVVYHDAFAFLAIQRDHWFKSLAWPWDGIRGLLGWTRNPDPNVAFMIGWMELGFIALGVLGTLVTAFVMRPSWTVWMAGNLLLFTSTSFVLSVPRYALTLFPLYAWFALVSDRRTVLAALSAVSLVGFAYFATLFAQGQWAF